MGIPFIVEKQFIPHVTIARVSGGDVALRINAVEIARLVSETGKLHMCRLSKANGDRLSRLGIELTNQHYGDDEEHSLIVASGKTIGSK